uniref:Uncharacterized protein n=1 Tax=Rhodnius prolixus TaxID=13249 RepID=T1HN42_RHOPR
MVYPIKYRVLTPSKVRAKRDIIFYFGFQFKDVYSDYSRNLLTNMRCDTSLYSKSLAKYLQFVMTKANRRRRRFTMKVAKHIFLAVSNKLLIRS